MKKMMTGTMVALVGMMAAAEVPTATVTAIGKSITVGGMPVTLDAAYRFAANGGGKTDYDSWVADFVVTFDRTVNPGDVDLYGQMGNLVPWTKQELTTIEANVPTRLIKWDALTYAVISTLGNFDCGAKASVGDLRMTVELRLFDPDGSASVTCASVTHVFRGTGTWFDARIAEYKSWPGDAAKAVGGAWDAGAAALSDVASVDAAGVLDVSAGKGQTLAFNADKAKTPSLDSGRVVIASDMDFSRCEIAEFPSVDPSWKCGVIVGAEEDGPAHYYGLAKCGTTNGWVKLEGPAPTTGTVPLRMTYRRGNGQAVATYNINGTDYTYGTAKDNRGKDVAVTNIAVVASGAVTGVAYGGSGSVESLSAEAAKLGTSVVVK